jgi:hypothetical protein
MADFDSSLPIRTENAGDVISKIADATTPSQQLKVEADGSINVNASAVDLDIRDLTHVSDSVKVGDGTDFLEVNADGSINSVVTATDLDIRDLDAASDSVAAHLFDEAGAAFSLTNPLPVSMVEGAGTEVNDYNTTAALAGGASDNHDLAITGDFLFKRVWASASGKMKIEVQADTGSGYETIAVGFNSTSNPNILVEFGPVQLASGDDIRIIRTNRDKQAQDVYSTIIGVEL